jgi:hypothetical protein
VTIHLTLTLTLTLTLNSLFLSRLHPHRICWLSGHRHTDRGHDPNPNPNPSLDPNPKFYLFEPYLSALTLLATREAHNENGTLQTLKLLT